MRAPDRIGAPHFEAPPALGRQRLLEHEETEQRVGDRDGGGDEERRARAIGVADDAAECGADDEADAEGGTREAEIRGALLRRRNVGDVGVDRRIGRARYAGEKAAHEQPDDGRRKAGDQVIDAERDERNDQHGTASKPVAQIAEDGRAEKLHQREDEHQPTAPARRARQAFAGQFGDDLGCHRNDDAKTDRVDQHGDEDEGQREAAGRPGNGLAHPSPKSDRLHRSGRLLRRLAIFSLSLLL